MAGTSESAELVKKHPDVDAFLIKKWERIFNAFFDRNASSEVDWGDFYLVVRQVRDIYGADSDQMKYARSSMKALWEGLLNVADKDKDEIITMDEWIALLKKTDPKEPPKWFNDYLNFMFKLFDVSGDDYIDLAEYTDGMLAYGFSTEDAHIAFHKIAHSASGKPLTMFDFQHFKKCWTEYFHSKNKDSFGNWVFGPILDDQTEEAAEEEKK